MTMSPLVYDRVEYAYGSTVAIRSVSAELPGGITGLLGRNGAGKTTLMRLAMGLLVPRAGHVSLLGEDPARTPACRLRVGYLPQHFSPPRHLMVREFLQIMALLSGVPRQRLRQAVDRALDTVGLRDRADKRIGSLSGGMIRRLGVVQALVHDPELLIVDEPAAGLDPEERLRLYRALRAFSQERPVLVSTHHVDEIEREADHLWMMRAGSLVWAGSTSAALQSVADKVREGELPPGVVPDGRVIEHKPTASGTLWRILGEDQRLATCTPTLLDAYLYHVGREVE